jgi:hypothetical protein
MVERRTKPGDRSPYDVGYGKPPVHSRFKPGQSGNPAGRRKGTRNLATDVRAMLELSVLLKEGGGTRKISTQEAALMKVREKALQGDIRALERVFDLASRFNNDGAQTETSQPLAANEHAILAAYVARMSAAPAKKPPGTAPDKAAPKPAARPKKPDPK